MAQVRPIHFYSADFPGLAWPGPQTAQFVICGSRHRDIDNHLSVPEELLV